MKKLISFFYFFFKIKTGGFQFQNIYKEKKFINDIKIKIECNKNIINQKIIENNNLLLKIKLYDTSNKKNLNFPVNNQFKKQNILTNNNYKLPILIQKKKDYIIYPNKIIFFEKPINRKPIFLKNNNINNNNNCFRNQKIFINPIQKQNNNFIKENKNIINNKYNLSLNKKNELDILKEEFSKNVKITESIYLN